jgi:hypothetical protein
MVPVDELHLAGSSDPNVQAMNLRSLKLVGTVRFTPETSVMFPSQA